MIDLSNDTHRRYNILTGEWVLVSPHRTKRPWQGQVEKNERVQRPTYDENCYLCPGNIRAGGHKNPDYKHTFVFKNDFGALIEDSPRDTYSKGDLLLAKGENGICKVICFSPRHDLTLPQMEVKEIVRVVELWTEEYLSLGSNPDINYVQIFENKGETMGCSNPHPHGQIWATSTIPDEPAKESKMMLEHFERTGNSLLGDYLALELEEKERVIFENDHFAVLSPFWAVWPYETIIISKRHIQHLGQFTEEEKEALAEAIKHLTVCYDNLFETSFPYSSGIHQAPTTGLDNEAWHFHMHFYPPLLRSATVKKFMVGFEMLGNPQRDITAEYSADKLRSLPTEHYLER